MGIFGLPILMLSAEKTEQLQLSEAEQALLA